MSKMKIFGVALIVGIAAFITVLATKMESPNAMPLTQLVDSDNKGMDFKAFQGKVVFVNNWASWCPPCIAEMPTIQQLKKKLKGENIVFVMVSFDDNHKKAKSFSMKKGYDFDVYFPGANYPFATASIPATFILDKSGKVVSQHVGMADYSRDDLVNQLKKLAHE